MTPEERLLLLKGLLGRIRSNAGERLAGSEAGDDEFIRRSVLDARELEETQEGSAAVRAAAAEADLAARAAARGAVEHVASAARAGSNGVSRPPPPIASSASAPLELDLFDPFEDEIELESPALGASGEHLVADGALARDEEPVDGEVEIGEVELEDDDEALFGDEELDRAPDTSHDRGAMALDPEDQRDLEEDDDGPDVETNRPPPRADMPATPPSSRRTASGWMEPPPAAISRIVATGPYPDEVTEDRPRGPGLELSFDDPESASEPPAPRRALDPLAQTAQNPIPAAMFERTILEEEEEEEAASGDLLDEATLEAMERDAQRQPSGVDEIEERGPISSRRPVDLDQPVDLGLESEPPPQSGEMTSTRQPSTGTLSALVHELDEATPHADEGARVAQQVRAMQAEQAPVEMLAAAAPAFGPVIVGRAPLAAATFVDVLDAALAFGEHGS